MKNGTKVKFKNLDGGHIPEFTIDIPCIIHGSTAVGEQYKKHGAIIRGEDEERYFVEFISNNDKPVCLGFKKDLIKTISWRSQYDV